MPTEFGLTSTCRFGCKVMKCGCGYLYVQHVSVYGCTTRVEHSSTGRRCTCAKVN